MNDVIDVMREAGKLLLPHFGTAAAKFKNQEVIGEITKHDTEVESYIEASLKKKYPDIGFKGEESGVKGSKGRFWLADPIDGTSFFARGIHGCTTQIALIDRAQIVFSVIYDFVRDELFHAERGRGAYLNDKKIHVSRRGLPDAMIYAEIDLTTPGNRSIYMNLKQFAYELGPYPAGIQLANVACGRAEARVSIGEGYDYDLAPGELLVMEAGGIVRNIGSESFDYMNNNVIAANPQVYASLTEELFPIHS